MSNGCRSLRRIYNEQSARKGGDFFERFIIAANDDLAEALIKAEQSVNYNGTPTILTGQDAGANGVANIKAGKQTMTIYKDPAILCAKIVRMVKAVVEGSQPAINDVTNIRNDVMTVPSYLCIPIIVDNENIAIVKNFDR